MAETPSKATLSKKKKKDKLTNASIKLIPEPEDYV